MTEFTTLFPHDVPLGAAETMAAGDKGLRIPMRPVKVGIGLSLLMAGVYGIVSDRQFLSTDNATVTAYLTEIRSPIDGILTGMPAAAGTHLEAGQVLGVVDNQLLDRQYLESLRIVEQQGRSGAAAAVSERTLLEAQEQELLARADSHLQAVSRRLQGEQAEAERLLAARVADREEAGVELGRGKQLHDLGILADADFDKLKARATVAAAEESAQRAAVDTLQVEIRAARAGILSEAGLGNDVSYSRQRADEIRIKVAELERSQRSLQAQAETAAANQQEESGRSALLSHTQLISPISGSIWQLAAGNGERVSSGEAVARVVDCERTFVMALIPQDREPEVALGASARLRLSGESRDRFGKVLGFSANTDLDRDRKLAGSPSRDPHQQLATVRISLEGDQSEECPVGRSARVLITVNDGSPVARLWRRYF